MDPNASAPAIFDRPLMRRRLARALREGYADFLVERAGADLTDRLGAVLREFPLALDLGTPTGAAARALAASGRVARVLRMAGAGEGADLKGFDLLGDEETLPFAPESLDLAVSLLALHGVNDLPGALAQVRRALKPDGLFIGCMLGGRTLHELREAFVTAEVEVTGGASPRVAPFADLRDLGSLLQRAGLALPVTDVDTIVVRYEHPLGLLRDLRAMGLTNSLLDRSRTPMRRAVLARMIELYAQRFSDRDGRVRATFELVWLSGWAPHESQQKPLRPGSAKMSLKDALGGPQRPA